MKHVHYVRVRRPGRKTRWYVYAWRGGPRIGTCEGNMKPRLDHDDLKLIQAAYEARTATDPATLRSLVRQWRSLDPARASSPEWERLAPATKRTWGRVLDLIDQRWGETPIELWNDPRMTAKVVAWRDSRAATPRSADIGVAVLRALLEFGRLRGRVAVNVAAGIPQLYRNGQRAEIVWTEDDMARFTKVALEQGKNHIVDGLRLAALTGLRREDLVTLKWSDVGEFAISKLALKRSQGRRRRVTVPRVPALDDLLEELRTRFRKDGVETVLVNSLGEAWSGDGFGGSFNRIRDAAGIVHIDEDSGQQQRKHLHDVRGTFCTRLLAQSDLGEREVADIMGWSPDKVASIRRVYVDQASVVRAISKRIMKSQNSGDDADAQEGARQ